MSWVPRPRALSLGLSCCVVVDVFFFFSLFRSLTITGFGGVSAAFMTSAAKLLSLLQGMVAAFLTQLMTMPVEMVVIRSQSALAGEPTSFRKTLASIIKEGGVGQLWSGLVPNSVLTINP